MVRNVAKGRGVSCGPKTRPLRLVHMLRRDSAGALLRHSVIGAVIRLSLIWNLYAPVLIPSESHEGPHTHQCWGNGLLPTSRMSQSVCHDLHFPPCPFPAVPHGVLGTPKSLKDLRSFCMQQHICPLASHLEDSSWQPACILSPLVTDRQVLASPLEDF